MQSRPYNFTLTWKPFLLRPNTPEEGLKKPPNTPENPRVGQWLKKAGEDVGLNFTGAADYVPNTIRAHILLSLAPDWKTQTTISENLFYQYFTVGANINDVNLLLSIAEKAGLDRNYVALELSNEENRQRIRREAEGFTKSVSGVPFYLIGDHSLSGAQNPEVFLETFDLAL